MKIDWQLAITLFVVVLLANFVYDFASSKFGFYEEDGSYEALG